MFLTERESTCQHYQWANEGSTFKDTLSSQHLKVSILVSGSPAWYFDAYYFAHVSIYSFSQFSSLKLEIQQMSLQIKKEAYISPSCLGFLPAGSNNLQKVTVSQIIGKQHPCNSKQQRIKDKGKYNCFFFLLIHQPAFIFMQSPLFPLETYFERFFDIKD